jgi:chromosome segregation ATPase
MRYGWTWSIAACLLSATAWTMVAGCASDDKPKQTAGEQRATAAVTGLKETRAELASARAQIDRTTTAMNAMRDEQGSLQTEFANFNKEVQATEAHAQKTRARANDMRARGSEYQAKWHAEMAKVSDPTLRAAASERANAVRERYETIATKANEARAAYEPYIRDLKGLQTYLSNDLTAAAVKSAAPVFDKTTANSKTVTEKIDAVLAELDAIASAMSPTGAAAPAPAKP